MEKVAMMTTPYYTLSADEVIRELDTDPVAGLSSQEAAARLATYGPNELEPPQRTPLWRIFLEQFNDFMIWVLLAAVAISIFEGQYIESIAIVCILLINAILGVYQEYRAEQALEALKEMSAPTALVFRDGELIEIQARELVVGDIVSLESGNKIPADGRLIEANALRCEEAALTGESKPARKDADASVAPESPLGDRTDMVFAGTAVSVGRGRYVVTGTATLTEMGNIARLMEEAEEGSTPLQVELTRVGKRIALLVLAVCAIVFIVDMVQGIDFSESLLVAISLAVAAIPEGLPAIVTIALALGVRRMADQNAIVKKLPAVETLGSTSFICSDKTGTLTQNVMTVRDVLVGLTPASLDPESGVQLSDGSINADDEALLFDIALSTNDARYNAEHVLIGDPTETALVVAAHARDSEAIARDRISEVPFDSDRKRMSTIHENTQGKREVFTKGGVDVVLSLCDQARIDGQIVEMTPELIDRIMKLNEQLAARGNRTLAFAYRPFDADEELEGEHIERGLIYVGIMAMLD
ncbi:MAG: HAD-IC family P-type ATPase, partial [Actinomycetia bacterium]|nr:HAD-IC family P-type ATPase [Actinomycetes bacterium]